MRLSEGNSLAGKVVGNICNQHEEIQIRLHLCSVHVQGGQDTVGNLDAVRYGFDVIEHRLDFVVCARETLLCAM